MTQRFRIPSLVLVTLCAGPSLAVAQRDATAHVLRRTSFGPTEGQVDALSIAYPTNLNNHLLQQLAGNLPETTEFNQGLADFQVPLAPTTNPYTGPAWSIDDLSKQNLYRAVWSENQLRELMTMFWQQSLSTSYWSVVSFLDQNAATYLTGVPGTSNFDKARKAAARMLQKENDAFRQNALGTFRDLLEASAKSASMLIYLDSVENTAGTNENYARELLELHTLGTGLLHGFNFIYDYGDVQELAKAFSGWDIVINTASGWPEFDFTYDTAPGESVLAMTGAQLFNQHVYTIALRGGQFTMPGVGAGQTGVVQGEAVLDYLADCVETRIWVCSRLIQFLVGYAPMHPLDPIWPAGSPNPPPQRKIPLPAGITEADLSLLLANCVGAWGPVAPGALDTGDITAVLTTILVSAPFNAADDRWTAIKNPFEYQASLMRSFNLDIPRDNAGNLNPRAALERANDTLRDDLGMALFRFPSPDGFPIHSEEVLSTSQYLYGNNSSQSVIADFRIVDPTQRLGGYPDVELNFDPLGFCLPGLFKGQTFNTQVANWQSYLTAYPPAVGTLDIGKKAQLVDHVHEALFSSDVLPSSVALSNNWLANWESTLFGYGTGPVGTEHLTYLMTLSDPITFPGTWNLTLDIWGKGMVGLMASTACAPQAFLK